MSQPCVHGEIAGCVRCAEANIVAPTINLHLLVDISPSMAVRWTQTISGLNEYLDALRTDEKDNDQPYKVSLHLFNDRLETRYSNVVLDQIPKLTEDNFKRHGFGTALYDAVHKTLRDIQTSDPVLMVIMTDGEDNSSIHGSEDLDKLMEDRKKLGNYTYAFLGISRESWGEVAKVRSFKASSNKITDAGYAESFVTTANSVGTRTATYSSFMRSQNLRKSSSPTSSVTMSVNSLFDDASYIIPTDATTENK